MTILVSIARVSHIPDAAEMADFHAAHRQVFGDCIGWMKLLRDPNDPRQTAVVGEVHDLQKMREISRTPQGDAMMRKFGFIEQLSQFLEDS